MRNHLSEQRAGWNLLTFSRILLRKQLFQSLPVGLVGEVSALALFSYWHWWVIPRLGDQIGDMRRRWPLGLFSWPDTYTNTQKGKGGKKNKTDKWVLGIEASSISFFNEWEMDTVRRQKPGKNKLDLLNWKPQMTVLHEWPSTTRMSTNYKLIDQFVSGTIFSPCQSAFHYTAGSLWSGSCTVDSREQS